MTKLTEIMHELLPLIDHNLNQGECGAIHFTMIVWCDCCDEPLYVGGDGTNTPRVLQMINGAADVILKNHELTEGHA